MADVSVNTFNPVVLASSTTTSGQVPTNFGVSVDRSSADNFMARNGLSNPPFNARSQNSSSHLQPKIKRGYIRKANNTRAGGGGVLYFMYNPPTITRQYLSYMDQAAIDPFNTIFQSGNSVAPPSIVQFSFDLIFDRQIEDAQRAGGRGALVDLDYYDLIVRNVTPSTNIGQTDVPDNGVMMVNPEDIVVVFGDYLTVQGRPINSQVQYTKFNEKMVPTQIQISLTMVINYFGPLRNTFGLDPGPQVSQYQALVPYPVTSSSLSQSDFQSGIDSFNNELAQLPTDPIRPDFTTPASPATDPSSDIYKTLSAMSGGSSGTTAATLASSILASSSTNSKAAYVAYNTFNGHGTVYDQNRRTQIPAYADCSSLVWYCYNSVGAGKVFGNSAWPPTQAMLGFWQSSNWSTMQRIMTWSAGGGNASQLLASAQQGDLLYIYEGSSHHVAIVYGVAGSSVNFIDASSPSAKPNVGLRTYSASSSLKEFRMLLRPVTAGASTAPNAVRNGATTLI